MSETDIRITQLFIDKKSLITVMAQICHFAQDHVGDAEAWDHSKDNLEYLFQCTSYQIACLLAQNTRDGLDGVEWEIVIDELTTMPPKEIEEWETIIEGYVDELGGLISEETKITYRSDFA